MFITKEAFGHIANNVAMDIENNIDDPAQRKIITMAFGIYAYKLQNELFKKDGKKDVISKNE